MIAQSDLNVKNRVSVCGNGNEGEDEGKPEGANFIVF